MTDLYAGAYPPADARLGDKWRDEEGVIRTLTVFEGREVWVDYYGEVME